MMAQNGGGQQIIDELLESGLLDRATARMVALMHRPDYSVGDLVRDTAVSRTRAGDRQELLDKLIAAAVEQTSVVYEAAVEEMAQGFCELSRDGTILFANPALQKLVAGCVGRNLMDYAPRYKAEIQALLARPKKGRLHRLELEADGEARPVLAEFCPIRGGTSLFVLIVNLTQSEEAERRALDTAPFPILKLDPDHRITYANEPASALFGLKREEVIGLEPEALVHTSQDRELLEGEYEKRRRGETSEYRLDLKPIEPLTAERVIVRSIPQPDPDGKLAGTFVTLSPLTAEQLGQRIWDAASSATDAEELWSCILDHLRSVISFDKAILSVYAPERAFSRVIYEWPRSDVDALWFPIPRAFRDVVEQCPYGSVDDNLRSLEGGEDLAQTRVVAELEERGLKGWIALPLQDPEQDAVFSLLHKDEGHYDEGSHRILEQAGLQRAMRAVLHLLREREREFRFRLVAAIARTENDRDLASLIAHELARFYGWQNVSVFKVNTVQRRFELLEQAAAARDGFLLPRGYCQNIETGFLGKAFREQAIKTVSNAFTGPDKDDFVRGSESTCSEMCVPVSLQGQIVWILNLEDQRPDAFLDPDKRTVEGLMSQIEAALGRSLGSALLNEVIDAVPDGVVITDTGGKILSCNLAAREMLGGEARNERLAAFFAEGSELAAAAAGQQTSYPVEGKVVGLDKNETRVLVRSSIPRVEYDRRVVFLQDAEKLQWQAETRQLIETLGSVAAQIRVPLSFASSLVRQIGRVAQDESPRMIELASRAIQHLSRIELTYDRVVDQATRISEPIPVRVRDVLAEALALLPSDLRDCVRLHDEVDPFVRTDRARFTNALTAMLAYMLRIGGLPDIDVRLRRFGEAVGISMSKPAPAAGKARGCGRALARDPLDEALARFALDEPGLHQFALTQRGLFRRRPTPGGESLRLVLRTE